MNEVHSDPESGPLKNRTLIAAWLVSVAAWFLHLSASYSFVEWYCRNSQTWSGIWVLHGLTLVALAVSLGSCYYAWRLRRRITAAASAATNNDPIIKRGLFMVNSGILMGLLMSLLIGATGAANFVVPLCIA